jgi:hypothetical protein
MESTEIIHLQCPAPVKAAVEAEAKNQMLSLSAYVRLAIARSLKADGVDLKRASRERADATE